MTWEELQRLAALRRLRDDELEPYPHNRHSLKGTSRADIRRRKNRRKTAARMRRMAAERQAVA